MQPVQLDNALLREYKGKQILFIENREKADTVINGSIVHIHVVNGTVVARIDLMGWVNASIESACDDNPCWNFMSGRKSFDFSANAFIEGDRLFLAPCPKGSRACIR